MLKFGNKEFRNLQEQVLKNMSDIQDVMSGATVLADFGIKVIGQVDDASELPDPATYEGEYGDAYMVGDEAPYDFYIFTRAFEGQEEPTWFNLGIFPQPGPQGPQGEAGTPVFPDISVAASATTLAAGSSAKATVTSTGSDSAPLFTFTFEIPQGAQGIQGIQGARGATGPQGPQGYISLLRPTAEACVAVGEGYMDASGNLQLLTSLDPRTFYNCGQLRGPQGYKGDTGERGPTSYVNILRATAEDCVALGEGYMNTSGYLMLLTDLDPRTFTNCGQLRGPQGSTGSQGPTGYVNIIRPDAASCAELYDAYVDSSGNLQILTTLPDTFTYGGRIKGETGTAATIQVGTVTTGEPGSAATVTNRGTSSAAIFDFSIPQGTPGEDVGINPTIPSGTPTSSLVAIKSGNDYYTVPQGETSLVFNVSIPSGETATNVSTIKDGQNYYTIPQGTGSANITFNPTVPSGATVVDLTKLKDDNTNTYYNVGSGTANIEFNATIPSGTTPTNLTTLKDENTDTYYSIAGGGGTANIEFNATPTYTSAHSYSPTLFTIKDENTNTIYEINRVKSTEKHGNDVNETELILHVGSRSTSPMTYPKITANSVIGGATAYKVDLGSSSRQFHDLYLENNLSDGNGHSLNVAAIASKQDGLVSGTNIKTINNTSILGSGDLTINEVPTVETTDKNKYLHTNATTGALEWAIAQDESIEANVTIPAGATVVELQNIKIGNTYYIMPGQTRYIVGDTLVDNSSTSSISNNTLTDNSVDINTTTNTVII